ncbi:MAG: DNA-packaging protein [Hyphomicrobium sp. SCN 65-11]|nr:MAG: DNA-packaging protein [Hyphomicrobium sp. SCN 65-11]
MLGLSDRPEPEREAALAVLSAIEIIRLAHDWQVWARDDQLAPIATETGQPWQTWLILGGRGSGKTRAGAEWVRARALGLGTEQDEPARRIALVGLTIAQVRSVMIEGVSGLLAVHAPHERPHFDISRNQIQWPNGAIAQMYAADDPDNLRGPQFDAAWCDELAKWRRAQHAWDMLQFALRLGRHPQSVVTTTPRSIALLKKLMADEGTVTSRAKTTDNAANLAPSFLSSVLKRYGGTALGRQEIDGEIVEDRGGGLWRKSWLDQHRVAAPPELARIVVAVDPPVTSNTNSDACGIIVAGLGEDGRAYVLADRTIRGREPTVWARAAIAAYRDFAADRIVAEVNQGGDLVVGVMRQVDASVPIRAVRATRGKWVRAEPVSTLYAEGRVIHVGEWPDLESQMCAFGADGLAQGKSPDRLDALVWALTDLMLTNPRSPTIRTL